MTSFDSFDNRSKILKDNLVAKIKAGDKMAVAAAYFSIFGFQELKTQLEGLEEMRFLYTAPTFLKEKTDYKAREFYIPRLGREHGVAGTKLEIRLRNELNQRAIARECADWIRKKASFRSFITQENVPSFLEVETVDDSYVYQNIEGITATGIGATPGSSPFTCITRQGSETAKQYLALFNQAWSSDAVTEDVTEQIIESITTMYKENAPELIYYSVLFDIFSEFLNNVDEDDLPKEAAGFKDSLIWNALYDFQKDAALAIINKLETYNGCILADSVGLGKTYTALAVIKYYEARNRNVLVLCPKKLSNNWMTYRNNQRNNPIADDQLRYDVLYHTDLLREHGISESGIDFATIRWENYDLVVIDESHNFRNGDRYVVKTKAGENRYTRLINKVIKAGIKTRVLMLSATPVNNRFLDLQNQLELAYQDSDVRWKDEIGLRNDVKTTFAQAQGVYGAWSKLPPVQRTTAELMDRLDPDFFKLLDQVTVARSRSQIMRYYDAEAIGPFPTRRDPISIRSELSSSEHVGSFSEIAETLNRLYLANYIPSLYIHPSKIRKYQEEGQIGLTGRETGVRRLMAVNLLKRLESSVWSFRLTLEKVRNSVAMRINLVDEYERTPNKIREGLGNVDVPDLDQDDEGSLEFTVGKAEIALEDMDWLRWREDMRRDLELLDEITHMVDAADPEHDSKLLDLKKFITKKIAEPFNDGNFKVLIFTAFSDTADYLFEYVSTWAKESYNLDTAIVTGDGCKSTIKDVPNDTQSILSCFSPKAKDRDLIAPSLTNKNIDILIATDCISEGQNLQDCDCVVNFDIHWNPVRIVQRFGRVDRIGSINASIQLVNFWPDMELDEYINLQSRVETRMKAVVMTSTGDDDLLDPGEEGDLEYRRHQLEQMQQKIVDLEDVTGGISITDLGLDEFRTDLLAWFKEHGTKDLPPHGSHAVVKGDVSGIIFVMRNVNQGVNVSKANRFHPFYLVFVGDDGFIRYGQLEARDTLSAIRTLCRGKVEADFNLCSIFNKRTKDGRDMREPTKLLQVAVDSIIQVDQKSIIDSFFDTGTSLIGERGAVKGIDDFELLSFLVVI